MFLWSQNSELENKGIGFYSLSCASIVSFFNTSIKVMISKQNNIFYSIFTPFEIPWSFLFIPASPLKRLISTVKLCSLRGYCTPGPYFWKTLCIFSKNKATSDKVFYGSGQKCSKELKKHSFTSVETIVVKLQCKMWANQYFICFEP